MISSSDIVMVILAFLIGYIDDINKPQPYYYGHEIIMLNKGYQCPTHCGVDHRHHVYFHSETGGMVIDEKFLGKKVKENKKRPTK